jgi:hypothetical protein
VENFEGREKRKEKGGGREASFFCAEVCWGGKKEMAHGLQSGRVAELQSGRVAELQN